MNIVDKLEILGRICVIAFAINIISYFALFFIFLTFFNLLLIPMFIILALIVLMYSLRRRELIKEEITLPDSMKEAKEVSIGGIKKAIHSEIESFSKERDEDEEF